MTQTLQNHTHSPLIGIIFEENGQEVVHYFTEEKAADAVRWSPNFGQVLKIGSCS
jgi:hypothetical protein